MGKLFDIFIKISGSFLFQASQNEYPKIDVSERRVRRILALSWQEIVAIGRENMDVVNYVCGWQL